MGPPSHSQPTPFSTDFSPDSLPVGLLLVDPTGAIRLANAIALERLGLASGDDRVSLGLTLSRCFASSSGGGGGADGAGGEEFTTRFDALIASGKPGIIESQPAARPDRLVTLDLHIRPHPDRGATIILIDADARAAENAELARLQSTLAHRERELARLGALQQELAEPDHPASFIGAAAPMLRMLDHIRRVAPTPATVLIHGESGSGKELVARALHFGSPRARRALIAVNCASLPENLIESELFGHERGSFTGADRQRLGKFELADTGTLFLDEIAELSPQAQAKLLRVLQEGDFERVGGAETIHVDVRLVAATHRDLAAQVQRGRFREDLFYRLNVFRIEVPPLRDRREDIRPLAEHFHATHARRLARPVLPISERSLRRMLTYRWPGNVRELENAVERATLLESGAELNIELPDSAPMGTTTLGGSGGGGRGDPASTSERSTDTSRIPRDVLLDLSLDQLQRLQIMHALETSRYRVFGAGGAAEKLAIKPQTLLSRMDKLGVPRPRAMRAAFAQPHLPRTNTAPPTE